MEEDEQGTLTVIAVIVSGIVLTSYILSNNYPIESSKLPRGSVDYNQSPTDIDFKLPKYIPECYCPYDSWGDNEIFIIFATCGGDFSQYMGNIWHNQVCAR